MATEAQTTQINHYINLAVKHRWYIIIPFIISMLIGLYQAFTLPKIYKSETLILIEPQRVPTNYVQSVVSTDIESRISTISQQIMSRSNIEKIMNEYKLFVGPDYDNMYLEDKLAIIRRRINVSVTRTGRNQADAFSVSYQGRDPRKVMNVANALASYFIDENLRVREAQAIGTSDFLENERVSMKKRLEEVEQALKDYRTQYMGELPEQLDSNLNILERLQDQLSQREQRLSDAKYRMTLLRNQNTAALATGATGNGGDGVGETSDLEQLRAQLTLLQAKYTERHPDVLKTKKLISDIEADLKNQANQTDPSSDDGSSSTQPRYGSYSRQTQDLEMEINGITKEINQINKDIKTYKARVEITPKREQELMSLTRDYNNMLESYNSILNRKLEAEIAVNMEKKQKGEQFRIIDPAKLPEKPISPNMKKLFLLFLAVGLGSGCGIIFMKDFMDASFKNREDAESFTDLPVLVTIPVIAKPSALKWKRINNLFSWISVAISFGLIAAFGVITLKGLDQSVEIANKIISIVR